MNVTIDLTVCPECGLTAEITDRTVLESTDGPIEHVRVRCIDRHHFFLPADRLATVPAPPSTDVVRNEGPRPHAA